MIPKFMKSPKANFNGKKNSPRDAWISSHWIGRHLSLIKWSSSFKAWMMKLLTDGDDRWPMTMEKACCVKTMKNVNELKSKWRQIKLQLYFYADRTLKIKFSLSFHHVTFSHDVASHFFLLSIQIIYKLHVLLLDKSFGSIAYTKISKPNTVVPI